MASIKNLEMAGAIATDSRISIKKSLFGQKYIYSPTGSEVKGYRNEYSNDHIALIKQLLNTSDDKTEVFVSEHKQPSPVGVGPLLVEVCASSDRQFAAVQAFTYYDLSYHPVGEIRTYEGDIAGKVTTFLIG